MKENKSSFLIMCYQYIRLTLAVILVLCVGVACYYAYLCDWKKPSHDELFSKMKEYATNWDRRSEVFPDINDSSLVDLTLFSIDAYRDYREDFAERYYANVWRAEKWFSDPQTLALCKAMLRRNIPEIERLIADGADPNARGKDNIRLLFWGVLLGSEIQEVLLRNGADPNFVVEYTYDVLDKRSTYEYLRNNSYICFLMAMADRESVEELRHGFFKEIVKILLKYCADPNFGNRSVLNYYWSYRTSVININFGNAAVWRSYGADPHRLADKRRPL